MNAHTPMPDHDTPCLDRLAVEIVQLDAEGGELRRRIVPVLRLLAKPGGRARAARALGL